MITFAKNPQELEFERKLFEKTNRSSRHIKLTEESSSTVAPSLNMEPVKEEEKKEEKKEPIEEQPAQTPEEEEKIKAVCKKSLVSDQIELRRVHPFLQQGKEALLGTQL